MNTTQAKQIKICDFLKSVGIEPIKVYSNYFYYKAPHREDNKPSFKVNTLKNLWYDLGTGNGGNIIDLVCEMYSCNVSTALQKLSNQNIKSFSFQSSNDILNNTSKIKINHIQPLQNKALIQYLTSRKITPIIAEKHISEAYYTIKNKKYFALAFKNDKGGFELRNKYFKGATTPKYITTLNIKESSSINIFEGFTDFLSALIFFKQKSPTFTTIILNSTSLKRHTLPIIKQYKIVNLFLDNDTSGQNAVSFFQDAHPNVKNRALQIYPNHKDFNQLLTQ